MAGRNGRAKPVVGPEASSGFPDPFESGVLFDERMLNREQVLARFFTPLPGNEHMRPTGERLFSTPDGSFALLNPRSAFVAPQIRELYDPGRIERMGVSIRDTVDGQLQNGGVSFLDDDHVGQYLSDMNEYFGTEIALEDLTRHQRFGRYIVTAYGHNRQFAIASANLQTNGHPDRGKRFLVKVFDNPEFWRILGNQATENTGENPPMWVRARQIVKYQAFRNRDGQYVTKEDVGRLFNVDKDQIWRAERYDALPQPIKDLVMADRLPYSGAFELDQLKDIYDRSYIISLASRLADSKASGPQILDAVKRRLAASRLTPEIRHIIDQGQITLLQAVELDKLRDFTTDDGLNEVAVWICTSRPDIDDIRSRVRRMIKERTGGVMQLYGDHSTVMSDPEVMARSVAEMRRAEILNGLKQVVRDMKKSLVGARVLIESGLIGEVVGFKPIAGDEPEYLRQLIVSLIDELNKTANDAHSNAVVEQLESLLSRGPETSEIATTVEDLLDEIRQLLELESSETPQTQEARRVAIAENIFTIISAPKPVQAGLF